MSRAPRLFQSLTFLGTSSGVPTPNRNVSSYCLNFTDGAVWMVDCGEGTQQQLQKCQTVSVGRIERIFITHLHGDHSFGLPGLMCSMSMMWQSPSKQAEAKKPQSAAAKKDGSSDDEVDDNDEDAREGPITFEKFSPNSEYLELVGPKHLGNYLRTALQASDSHFGYKFRITELWPQCPEAERKKNPFEGIELHPCEADPIVKYANADGYFDSLGSSDSFRGVTVKAAELDHRIYCVGYVVTEEEAPGSLNMEMATKLGVPKGPLLSQLKAGKDVSFTTKDGDTKTVKAADCVGAPIAGRSAVLLGDTCNSDKMLKVLSKPSYLVHEATFDDKSAALAVPRGHSTARMAANFASRIQARNLLLTHFSARYPARSKDPAPIAKLEEEARDEIKSFHQLPSGDSLPVSVLAVDDFSCVEMIRSKK